MSATSSRQSRPRDSRWFHERDCRDDAAGLSDDLPFGGILADLMAGRQHISNQYEYVGSSWGGAMFGAENRDLML